MSDDDYDPDEVAASLQMEIVDAAHTLMDEHGYSRDDVLAILPAFLSESKT